MAADVVIDPQLANACCAELRKRYSKLEEKRNALRQAVKLLEGQTNKLEEEKNVLKRAYEEEHARAELSHQASKESLESKLKLEKEVNKLKSEISSLKKNGNSENLARNHLLASQISEREAEINRLKDLLQKEVRRGDVEKKKAEEEKNKAAEAWNLLKVEKKKVEDEKRVTEIERKKAEESREKLVAEQSKSEAVKKKLEAEKKKAIKEKKRADLERENAEQQTRLLETERKRLADEKAISERLSKQLQENSQKLEGIVLKRGKKLRKEDEETTNAKLLREKVKFLKEQLRHYKKMAKLHKSEKIMLLHQFYLLKQDHMQFSHRLEMITSCFPFVNSSPKGVGKSLKKHALKHAVNSQVKPEKSKNTMEYHVTSLPRGRGCILPVSGTCSDLESVRDRSQSSTDLTYSDTRLVGSQERGALAVAMPVKVDARSISCEKKRKRKAGDIVGPSRSKILKKIISSSSMGEDEHALKSDDIHMESSSPKGMDVDDYMKLLDSDDEAKEKRYQEARKMLLSPNLPEIKFSSGREDVVVVFSEMKDEQTISKILRVTGDVSQETCYADGKGFALAKVLQTLTHREDLSHEEKVSVVCSLMLRNMSGKISVIEDASSFSSESFDEETRSLFLRTCQMDSFVRLLEDFLVDRRIVVCGEDEDKAWVLRTARLGELLAGGIILAITCSSLGRVDFLWRALYRLLLSCRGDSHWILTAVHVFGRVCREKLVSSADSGLLPRIVWSMVSLLERERETEEDPGSSVFSLAGREVCPEKMASLLMDELRANLDDAVTSSCGCEDNDCPLQDLARRLGQHVDHRLCSFADMASLIELTGHYMGWLWLRRFIIPRLFELLESRLSVPLLVLIGQLIGNGVKFSAAQVEEDAEDLISSLSRFLERERMVGRGVELLPAQLAAVEALLRLLPLDFRDMISEPPGDIVPLRGGRRACVELVRRWFFSGLSEDQMAAAARFFVEDADERNL